MVFEAGETQIQETQRSQKLEEPVSRTAPARKHDPKERNLGIQGPVDGSIQQPRALRRRDAALGTIPQGADVGPPAKPKSSSEPRQLQGKGIDSRNRQKLCRKTPVGTLCTAPEAYHKKQGY